MDSPEQQDRPSLECFQIKTHHFNWILDAAYRHFADQITELELLSLRCERFTDRPLYKSPIGQALSRHDKLERLNDRIEEYERIAAFILYLRNKVTEQLSEEFADSLRQSGFFER
ncbi:MAG: hypothetical protein IH897_08780 [Planctomycetes bacterium]|nr:hypothetical protein [Planctomycetota bacterium]